MRSAASEHHVLTLYSMKSPNLTTVYRGLTIMSGSYDVYSDHILPSASNFSLPGQPIDIELPKLYNSSLLIAGNISSLNAPELTVTIGEGVVGDQGIKFGNCGNPLNLSFPKLSGTAQVNLVGAIGSVSLPSLLNTGTISVAAYSPLNLTLDPLQQVYDLHISGNITGISMPTMTNLTQGSITSELPLDCNEVYKVWDQEHPIRNGFSCTGYVKRQFPRGAKIGMGVGIPILIALCVGVVYLCMKLRRRRKAAMEAAAVAAKIVQPVEDVFPGMS